MNFAIQRGLTLSKSQVYFYKHNDLKDLELILIKINEEQKKVLFSAQKNIFINFFRKKHH